MTMVCLLLACGCGDSFNGAEPPVDGATRADVVHGRGAPSTAIAPPAGDMASDAAAGDELLDDAAAGDELLDAAAGDVDAAVAPDVGACTPVTFPIPSPVGCVLGVGSTAEGNLWVMQASATPINCRSYPLAGSTACEDCVEHFTCACLAPLLAAALKEAGPSSQWDRGTGRGCVDTATSPYFSQ